MTRSYERWLVFGGGEREKNGVIYIRLLLLRIKLRAQRIFNLGSHFEGVGALYRSVRLKSIGSWEILAHRLVCKWVYGGWKAIETFLKSI